MARNRPRQVAMLHRQALHGQRLLEGETAALAGELERLRQAREALRLVEPVGLAQTAGLQGNATRHRASLEGRRAALTEQIAAAQRDLELRRVRLREARQAAAGWERLAERLAERERQRLARQEQEMIDQHGQWRSQRPG